jgi:hypothetical protein
VLLAIGCVLAVLLLPSFASLITHRSSNTGLPVKADQSPGPRSKLRDHTARSSTAKTAAEAAATKATAAAAPLRGSYEPSQQEQQWTGSEQQQQRQQKQEQGPGLRLHPDGTSHAQQHQQQAHAASKKGSSAGTGAASSRKDSGANTGSSPEHRDTSKPAAADEAGSSLPQVQALGGPAAHPQDPALIQTAAENGRAQQRQSGAAAQQQQQGAAVVQQYSIDPADGTSVYIQIRGTKPAKLKYPLWWHGPLWSGSGYSSGEFKAELLFVGWHIVQVS